MKKKILFVAHSMELGGAESSLLGILENMDYEKYSVDLFLLRRNGELLNDVPSEVNILPEMKQYSCLGIPIGTAMKRGQFQVVAARGVAKLLAKRRIKQLGLSEDNNVINEYSHKYIAKVLPVISKIDYDVAISFVSPHYFVSNKVRAKKKIAWIHTDYATLDVDTSSELLMWKCYDKIVSISHQVTQSFLKTFPSLACKIVLIENIMPMKRLRRLSEQEEANDEFFAPNEEIKLLSIGRFVAQKNFSAVPAICKIINQQDVNIVWYIIGYGMEESKIKQAIVDNEMSGKVVILGKKGNPYPYLSKCDVYVQPSCYEGKSIAVREAQLFHKPVIITDYCTAHSQLEDGVDGVIVPMELNACANAIAGTIKNSQLLASIAANTYERDYVGAAEVQKLYALMEDDDD